MRCKQISKMEVLSLRILEYHSSMCPWNACWRIRPKINKLKIFMNEYVNPPCNSSLATSSIIRNIEFDRRRKRSEEDIPVCWTNSRGRSIWDWWRSGRENCVPRSLICPHFRFSRERTSGVRWENFRVVGWWGHFSYWASVWRRRWRWRYVCGRGWQWTER